jgi:hypothetical protein
VPLRLHIARTIKAGVKMYQYTPITSTYRDERNGSPCLKALCLQRSITKNRKKDTAVSDDPMILIPTVVDRVYQ